MDDERLAACLRALGDPNRLSIFTLLRQGQQCNCNMGDKLGLAANLVSHHLKVLRECGLVVAERHPTDGRWILYSLNRDTVAELAGRLAAFLQAVPPTDAACACGPSVRLGKVASSVAAASPLWHGIPAGARAVRPGQPGRLPGGARAAVPGAGLLHRRGADGAGAQGGGDALPGPQHAQATSPTRRRPWPGRCWPSAPAPSCRSSPASTRRAPGWARRSPSCSSPRPPTSWRWPTPASPSAATSPWRASCSRSLSASASA